MNPQTLEALKGSIAKWEAIVLGQGVDRGPDNCPLCKQFRKIKERFVSCAGCPVAQRTGLNGCKGTPYEDYERASIQGSSPKRLTERARKELAFLKSLLPKEIP